MQLFDSLTIPEQQQGNFFVHTRLTLIESLDQEEDSHEMSCAETPGVEDTMDSVHQHAEAETESRRGFLDNLIVCGSCRQPMTYSREWGVYQAEHHEDCPHLMPVSAFLLESQISSALKKMVTPENVTNALRYQEKLRAQRQSECNRLRHELEMLRSQVQRHFRFRTHGHLISAHQQQLHSALEKANKRRIVYLEEALSAWEQGPACLDEADGLALCLLARDFGRIWGFGSRAVRRRIVHELISEILVFPQEQNCHTECHWKVTGLELRQPRDVSAI